MCDYRPTKAGRVYADIRTGSPGTAISVRSATGNWMLSRGTTQYSPRLPGVAMFDRYAEDVLRCADYVVVFLGDASSVALATRTCLDDVRKTNKVALMSRRQSCDEQ